MTKIRIFSAAYPGQLESDINSFLQKQEDEIVSIQPMVGCGCFAAMVVIREPKEA